MFVPCFVVVVARSFKELTMYVLKDFPFKVIYSNVTLAIADMLFVSSPGSYSVDNKMEEIQTLWRQSDFNKAIKLQTLSEARDHGEDS